MHNILRAKETILKAGDIQKAEFNKKLSEYKQQIKDAELKISEAKRLTNELLAEHEKNVSSAEIVKLISEITGADESLARFFTILEYADDVELTHKIVDYDAFFSERAYSWIKIRLGETGNKSVFTSGDFIFSGEAATQMKAFLGNLRDDRNIYSALYISLLSKPEEARTQKDKKYIAEVSTEIATVTENKALDLREEFPENVSYCYSTIYFDGERPSDVRAMSINNDASVYYKVNTRTLLPMNCYYETWDYEKYFDPSKYGSVMVKCSSKRKALPSAGCLESITFNDKGDVVQVNFSIGKPSKAGRAPRITHFRSTVLNRHLFETDLDVEMLPSSYIDELQDAGLFFDKGFYDKYIRKTKE